MALNQLGSFTLGGINIGLFAALGFLNPLAAQLDLALFGAFGLGTLLADLQAQFAAAISAVTSVGIQIGNPLFAIQSLIAASAQLYAALQLVLSLGLPNVTLTLSAQLAAAAALAATLQVKIGGIKAMISAAAAIKIPAIQFLADMQAALNAGPVHLLSFTGSTLSATGSQVQAAFAAGLGPSNQILPGDVVSGVILVTKDPAAFVSMGLVLKTS